MRLSPEIVSAMQGLAVDQRRILGARAPWHIGDLAWGTRQHEGREREWEIRLWVADGRPVAWSWLRQEPPGLLDHDVHRDHQHLLDEILADPRARAACAFEDDAEGRAALARHGFTQAAGQTHFNVRDVEPAPEPPSLPPGFSYRVATAADIAERVAIHCDVWAPSGVSESSYAGVREQRPYRESLDCVIEAPDGRFAAYCLCWPDDENAVAELEPVGVRPEFRRRGLGAAVCLYALRQWREQGGRQAIVYCANAPACALYESIGFRRHATLVEYRRPEPDTALVS